MVLGIVSGIILLEIASYLMHRFLFHGPLWIWHGSHHRARKGFFEANDYLSGFFMFVTILALYVERDRLKTSFLAALAMGFSIYGMGYFILHDIYAHGRIWKLNWNVRWFNRLRQAHRVHHQSAEKKGQDPFGFLWVPGTLKKLDSRSKVVNH